MIEVQNKFQIGEHCYTFYKKSLYYQCPVCDGYGRINYKNYDVKCGNCDGKGKVHAHQTVLEPCEVSIKKIRVSINVDGNIFVKYAVDSLEDKASIRNRSEESLFKNINDCELYCMEQNIK